MGLLEQLTLGQILTLVIGILLAAAGAVNTVGAAIERIYKLKQAAQAPNTEQDKRLNRLEQRMDEAERKLGRDYAAFQSLTESTAVTQRAILALLSHGLHGNNMKEMAEAERELTTYLTNHH